MFRSRFRKSDGRFLCYLRDSVNNHSYIVVGVHNHERAFTCG